MHCKSYSHFFSKKFQHICISLDINFNESLTNDIVSFEQLGPDHFTMDIYIKLLISGSDVFFIKKQDDVKKKNAIGFINFIKLYGNLMTYGAVYQLMRLYLSTAYLMTTKVNKLYILLQK